MSGWTSNDPSIRATKSTAQYAREQEMNERIMAQKPVDQMTAEELVRALKPCECDHLTGDHDVRGWCCRYQCPCRKYIERVFE